MAYQKEFWPTGEAVRNEIGEILARADFLDYEDEGDLDSQREYMQFQIIPQVIDELLDFSEDKYDKYRLDYIDHLITDDQIGVELAKEKRASKVQLITYEVDDDSASLVVLIAPSVRASLESADDRGDFVNKFKEVLLLALDKYQKMSDEGVFVPYSRV